MKTKKMTASLQSISIQLEAIQNPSNIKGGKDKKYEIRKGGKGHRPIVSADEPYYPLP